MTEPPPRATFSANVTQWEIYDAYLEEEEAVKLRIGDKARVCSCYLLNLMFAGYQSGRGQKG